MSVYGKLEFLSQTMSEAGMLTNAIVEELMAMQSNVADTPYAQGYRAALGEVLDLIAPALPEGWVIVADIGAVSMLRRMPVD